MTKSLLQGAEMVDNQMTNLLAAVENARGRKSAPNDAAPLRAAEAVSLREFFKPEHNESTHRAADADRSELDGSQQLDVRIELGRARLRRDESHQLRPGAIVALDPMVGEPVDVYVADRRVARGELLAVDGKYAVRVTERFATP